MDGIFGVGLPEMLIIALVIFIVGGPNNTTKWARELGRTVRQAREAWGKLIDEIEKDAPGTKEMVNTAVELSQGVRDMAIAPQRMMNEAFRLADTSGAAPENTPPAGQPAAPIQPPAPNSVSPANGKQYPAWLPPEDTQKS